MEKKPILLSSSELEKKLDAFFEEQPGAKFPLTVTGHSMVPFLVEKRDSVFLEKKQSPIRKGDIVLYKRSGGRLVLHRVIQKKGNILFIAGDNEDVKEKVPEENVIAVCREAIRKGKHIERKNFVWRLFSVPWRLILPWRKRLMIMYARVGKKNTKV